MPSDAKPEDETERLMSEYHEVRREHYFYREELLDMAKSGDQDSEMWCEYQEAMKELARKEMKLGRELLSRGIKPSSDGVTA